MMSKISSVISGASPREGSSRSNSRGWAIKARPMATICCSPPERVLVRWPARSLSLGNRAETASRRRASSGRLSLKARAPSSRFSLTVRSPNISRPSGHRATPLAAMAAGVEPVTSTPSRKMRPPDGGASPMTALSRLVLPAPLAPTRATVSPGATARSMPNSAWAAP